MAVQRVPHAPFEAVRACVTPLTGLAGVEVRTVEGLSESTELQPLQRAFLEHFSFQCGYCTSGFLNSSLVLMERLKRSPVAPEQLDEAIEEALGAHICRCTGYVRYHQAVKSVIVKMPGLVVPHQRTLDAASSEEIGGAVAGSPLAAGV